MALVKFISGDGVEHEVEEGSMAADVMCTNGFQQVGADKIDDLPPAAVGVYTEEDAIAQNDGDDVSTEAPAKTAPAKKAPVKKKANA